MSVTLISVSQDTVVSNKHEEQTRHYYVIFQQKQALISNSDNPGIHLPLMASHASSIPGKPSDLNRAPTNGTTQETYYAGPDVA